MRPVEPMRLVKLDTNSGTRHWWGQTQVGPDTGIARHWWCQKLVGLDTSGARHWWGWGQALVEQNTGLDRY